MRKGFLIYEEMCKYFPIYEEAGSHIWLCNCSIMNFLIYEENLIFFFISAYCKNFWKSELKTGTHFAFLRASPCVLRIKNAFQRSGEISILVGHKQVQELDNCLGGLERGLGCAAQRARHPLGTGSTLADSAQQEHTVLELAYGGIYKQNGEN